MTQKKFTPVITLTLAVLALAASGCNTTAGKNPAFVNRNRNFFNAVTIEPDSFAYRAPQTLEVRTSDIMTQPNPSGTKVSLLAGLITFVDY